MMDDSIRNGPIVRCIRKGLIAYPVSKNRHWYIEVNHNGKIITYDKSIGYGDVLQGKKLDEPLRKVYAHWDEKLTNKNK